MSATARLSLASRLSPSSTLAWAAWNVGLIAGGSLLLTIAAKTKIELFAVPVTLQTLAVFAIAAGFGMRLGLATILAYLAQGAMGLPVFAGTPEKGIGIAYMLGTTGGYLAGFVVAMAVVGWAADRGFARNPLKIGGFMVLGEIAILALGALWLAYLLGVEAAMTFGVGPFIYGDLVKLALAACAVPAVTALLVRN